VLIVGYIKGYPVSFCVILDYQTSSYIHYVIEPLATILFNGLGAADFFEVGRSTRNLPPITRYVLAPHVTPVIRSQPRISVIQIKACVMRRQFNNLFSPGLRIA
jgi:hypothetical protein